ncbi:MAG: antibiotic biosynthesis monooxygenase, partial [Deltaproteobacteria bacterium]|nr:antibiotic biosynthesis monooxygenase [Deltaproteobacteria bacterium]
MAVKIIIKRIVPENKAEALKPLLQKLRNLAM